MNNQENPRDQELGALWLKMGDKGDYMTGSVIIDGRKTDIVVFPNQFKFKDNHPAYRILRSRPKEERTSTRRDEQAYQDTHGNGFPAPGRPGPAQ